MSLFSIELAPLFHREGAPVALATGAVTLLAACAAVWIATARKTPEWRRAWLLAAWLCLFLALDEALPVDRWTQRYTGLHWWLVYLVPAGVGVWGWLRAMALLELELPWHSRPVQLLSRGTLCWLAAFAARGFAFLNEHGPGIRLSGIPLLVEAIFKMAGALIWLVALAQIFIRIRAPRAARTPTTAPFVGRQTHLRPASLARGGSEPDGKA